MPVGGRLMKEGRAAALLALLLLSGVAEQALGAPGAGGVRVRKELRDLTDEEFKALAVGLATMQAISTDSGRRLFGDKYLSYTELLLRHAVSVNDPRGDQGHASSCFMTFHRAFLLELENSLLSVAPELKALPYWDITLDNPGAKYYGTNESIWSDKYAGKLDGDPDAYNGVTTGLFAWRQVQKFLPEQWPQYRDFFGGNSGGYLRSKTDLNNRPLVTRFPRQNLAQAVNETLASGVFDGPVGTMLNVTGVGGGGTANGTGGAMPSTQTDDELPFGSQEALEFEADYLFNDEGRVTFVYPPENYERCLNASAYTKWVEWNMCLDYSVVMSAPDLTEAERDFYVGPEAGSTPILHAGMHWSVGSIGDNTDDPGDVFDVATSPNDVMIFFLHHANLDRSAMTWQINAAELDPSIAERSWEYPATPEDWNSPPGCLLNDVVNANAAFKTLFAQPPADPAGYTHGEVIALTAPGKAPYTYATLLGTGADAGAPAPTAAPATSAAAPAAPRLAAALLAAAVLAAALL